MIITYEEKLVAQFREKWYATEYAKGYAIGLKEARTDRAILSKTETLNGYIAYYEKTIICLNKLLVKKEISLKGYNFLIKPYHAIISKYIKRISLLNKKLTGQVNRQSLKVVAIIQGEMSRAELMEALHLKHRDYFTESYLNPALKEKLLEMTLPEKPNSRLQKYRLTDKGKKLRNTILP